MKKLTKSFKIAFTKAQKFLNKIEYINEGGCVLAALALKSVAKRYNIPCKVSYMYRYDCGALEEARDTVSNGKYNPLSDCDHAAVNINGVYYDSKGTEFCKDFPYKVDTRSHKIVLKSFQNKNIWNPAFDRNNVKLVEKRFNLKIK